jgi:hypothetical protein
MLTFRQFITEEKNVHMTHAEDAVIDGGVNGTRNVINYFRALRDMLAGNTKAPVNVTVKWDGCVHQDTVICTNKGEMKIKEICESEHLWDSLLIKGYDFETNLVVMTPLFGGMSEDGDKDWVEVVTEEGSLLLTEDHEVHTSNRGWIKAGELAEQDDITEL